MGQFRGFLRNTDRVVSLEVLHCETRIGSACFWRLHFDGLWREQTGLRILSHGGTYFWIVRFRTGFEQTVVWNVMGYGVLSAMLKFSRWSRLSEPHSYRTYLPLVYEKRLPLLRSALSGDPPQSFSFTLSNEDFPDLSPLPPLRIIVLLGDTSHCFGAMKASCFGGSGDLESVGQWRVVRRFGFPT